MKPDPHTPPKLPSGLPGKFLRSFVIAAAILLALATGAVFVDGWFGRRSWNRYVKEAAERGQKLKLSEFLPPRVPDAENFAAAPPFSRAFSSAQDHPEWKIPFTLPPDPPAFSNPRKGLRIDLAAWKQFFVREKWLAKDESEAPPAAVLHALDGHFAVPWEELREAASRPKCRFPVHWERGIGAELLHLDPMQSAARIASLRMEAHLALHDPATALEDFRIGMRLVSALDKEPGMIDGLARLSLLNALLSSVWSGLEGHLWDANSCRGVESDLARLNLPVDCRFSLDSERALMNFCYAEAKVKKLSPIKTLFSPHRHDNKVAEMFALFPDGFLYANRERSNRYYDDLNADLDPQKPLWHPSFPNAAESAEASQKLQEPSRSSIPVHGYEPGTAHGFARLRYFLHEFSTPKLGLPQSKFLFAHTLVQETRLACALEEFRLAHDQYPETLQALTPEFLRTLPLDLMNGEPFHYRRTDAGRSLLLYSVGMNQRDDNGAVDTGKKYTEQLDWVWPFLAK